MGSLSKTTTMASSSKSKTRYNIRSISLPCRSHPNTLKIEEKLNNFKTWEASSSMPTAHTICNSLSTLEELYKCLDDLLSLPLIQHAISLQQHDEWADELLDGSVRLLDICGSTRDIMSQIKQHIRDLRSALRRRKGDLRIETSIAKYTSFKKKMNKDAKKLVSALKQVDNKIRGSPVLDLDHHLTSVIRVLREVIVTNISILQSVLMFISVPISKPTRNKWLLVSKLVQKGTIASKHQDENVNELESVDVALWRYGSSEGAKVQISEKGLEAVEGGIEDIENGLGCMFRHLISARVGILNIISQ